MATKAMNFRMDETEIQDMRNVASVFHMTLTDYIKEAIKEYTKKKKEDPFYRLTANVEEASAEETTEILEEIEGLSNDDLTIATTRHFSV